MVIKLYLDQSMGVLWSSFEMRILINIVRSKNYMKIKYDMKDIIDKTMLNISLNTKFDNCWKKKWLQIKKSYFQKKNISFN